MYKDDRYYYNSNKIVNATLGVVECVWLDWPWKSLLASKWTSWRYKQPPVENSSIRSCVWNSWHVLDGDGDGDGDDGDDDDDDDDDDGEDDDDDDDNNDGESGDRWQGIGGFSLTLLIRMLRSNSTFCIRDLLAIQSSREFPVSGWW